MKSGLWIIVFSSIFSLIPIALACEGEFPVDYSLATERSDYVFVGLVRDIDPSDIEDNELIIFDNEIICWKKALEILTICGHIL